MGANVGACSASCAGRAACSAARTLRSLLVEVSADADDELEELLTGHGLIRAEAEAGRRGADRAGRNVIYRRAA